MSFCWINEYIDTLYSFLFLVSLKTGCVWFFLKNENMEVSNTKSSSYVLIGDGFERLEKNVQKFLLFVAQHLLLNTTNNID